MDTLQDPTLGLLIQVVSPWTASDIRTLMMRSDLSRFGATGKEANKQELLRTPLLGAQKAARNGDTTAHRSLLNFVSTS